MRLVRLLRSDQEKDGLKQPALVKAFPLFNPDYLPCRSYLAVYEDGSLIGLAGIADQSQRLPGYLGVAFISTHRLHRHQGVARLLVSALFELARRRRCGLCTTPYSRKGRKWLRPLLKATSFQYPDVPFFESNR